MKGRYFCTACGLCDFHHDGPLCLSSDTHEAAWDPIGFDLRTVIRTAHAGSWIPDIVTPKSCPYCRWDRPLMINMSKPPMLFDDGVWERAKNSQLPS